MKLLNNKLSLSRQCLSNVGHEGGRVKYLIFLSTVGMLINISSRNAQSNRIKPQMINDNDACIRLFHLWVAALS